VSLRLRLALAGAVLLATLSLLGALLINSVNHSELAQIDQQLRDSFPVANSVRVGIVGPTGIAPAPGQFTQIAVNHVSAFYIAAVVNGRRHVISTPVDTKGAAPSSPAVVNHSARHLTIVTVGSVSGSLRWRALLVRRPSSHNEMLVAAPLAQVETTLSFLRVALLVAGAVVLAVVGAASFWIMRLGLGPLAEVTEVAGAIAAGDRSRRVRPARRGTEAARLAEAFNAMSDEQLALEARLRQFVADASHELRTPVSVIVGITELWRRGELRDGEDRDEAMHRIGLSGNRMGRLVEELLLLARLDENPVLQREPVDVAALVRDAVAEAAVTDPARTITLESVGDAVVDADPSSVRRVVANLLANALRHTPSTAPVTVRVGARVGAVDVEVIDGGPGMTPEQVEHAFDRFWQADPSRARVGSGLGLSIVQGVVLAHGGTVTLESRPDTGTAVRVTLPRTKAANGANAAER
jgi:two-component system, OmpR family, sensor kinase